MAFGYKIWSVGEAKGCFLEDCMNNKKTQSYMTAAG